MAKVILISLILFSILLFGCSKNVLIPIQPIASYGEMYNYTSAGYVFLIDDPDVYYNISGL